MKKNHMSNEEQKVLAAEISEKLRPLDESIPEPQSLSPEKIREDLSEKPAPPLRIVSKRAQVWKKATAYAACILLLLTSVFGLMGLKSYLGTLGISSVRASDSNQNLTDYQNYEEIREAISEYTGIQRYGYADAEGDFNAAPPGARSSASSATSSATTTSPAKNGAIGSSSSNSHTETNLQVEGVDEADVIKNDGKYLYILNGEQIHIVNAYPADQMKIVASITPDKNRVAYVFDMYVAGDRLVALGTLKNDDLYSGSSRYSGGCMVDGCYYYSGVTCALVYDIGDKGKPKLLRTYEQDGQYVSSRLIDDDLCLITNKYIPYVEKDTKGEDLVPKYRDSSAIGNTLKPLAVRDIKIPSEIYNTTYLVVSSLNIADAKSPISHKAYLGSSQMIYSDKDSIYAASTVYANSETTKIVKFDINDGKVFYAASGSVPGAVLNQFSMDEYGGNFRIATTIQRQFFSSGDRDWESASKNNVYVLDNTLNVIGKLEGLAKGERIYSVRFEEKTCYMVTFRQVDPLFVIDLSDPKKPTVTGELKIPGFSEYLHPYSDNLMIGIGQSATTEGRTQGMKVSLFDVSDKENPKELHSLKAGSDSSFSDAEYNHKAFVFYKEKMIFAIPVCQYGYTDQDDYTYMNAQANFILYTVRSNKLVEVGRVENSAKDGNFNIRGTMIDNVLYTTTFKNLIATDMDSFQKVKEISLPYPEQNYYEIYDY